jgi:hypothetical protein
MKNFIFSFIVFFFAVNTPLSYNFQFDGDFISKYNDKIPDGYNFNKPFIGSYLKTGFGIPDTSVVKIELHDAKDSVIYSTVSRLGGGNYYFDWQNIVSENSFKSGVYNVILNAELDRTAYTYSHMKFSGRCRIVFVK